MILNLNLDKEDVYEAAGISKERFQEIHLKVMEDIKEKSIQSDGDNPNEVMIDNVTLIQIIASKCINNEELAIFSAFYFQDLLNYLMDE